MRLGFSAGVLLILILGDGSLSARGQQQQPNGTPRVISTAPPTASVLESLSGLWDYNADLSVDAATGRPEQAPRSAAARPVGSAAPAQAPAAPRPPAAGGGAPTGGSGSSGGSGTGSGGSSAPVGATGGVGGGMGSSGGGNSTYDEARRTMALILAAERRTLLRDLLEVPEKLTIRATADQVSITDDLKRERVFATDGKKRKYQISAATFNATAGWQDAAFRKVIDGPNNFRMTETYFLSEDGRRLFVIIRIGDPKRPEMMAGINRVYDRIAGSPQ